MINLLATLSAPAPSAGTAPPQDPEADRPFAGLLGLLGGKTPAAKAEQQPGALAGMVEKTAAALSEPDLSDEEIEAILAPLLARLGAELARDPALMAKVKAMVANLGEVQMEAASADTPEADTPWRTLAEGLSELQDLLDGAAQTGGPGPEFATLLSHVLQVATQMTQEAARPFAPLLAGFDQMAAAPGDERSGPGGASMGSDLAATEAEELAEALSESSAETEGDGAATGQGGSADFDAGILRGSQTSAAALASAAFTPGDGQTTAGQGSTLQAQATPLAAVSAMPANASAMTAAQIAGSTPFAPAPQSQEILGQIRANLRDDGHIKVELKPEGLGKVEISLGPDEAGKMQVVVRADQAAVLSALRADRDGLVALLRDAGHTLDESMMSFSDLGAGEGGQGGDPEQATGGFGTYGAARQEATGLDAAMHTDTLRLPAGSVDIRI